MKEEVASTLIRRCFEINQAQPKYVTPLSIEIHYITPQYYLHSHTIGLITLHATSYQYLPIGRYATSVFMVFKTSALIPIFLSVYHSDLDLL